MAAVQQGHLRASTVESGLDHVPFAAFYNADGFADNLKALREAFEPPSDGSAVSGSPVHFLHATAVKTNPTAGLLRLGKHYGHGAECASVGEVQHSLRLGFDPKEVVFDSPCKTEAEYVTIHTHASPLMHTVAGITGIVIHYEHLLCCCCAWLMHAAAGCCVFMLLLGVHTHAHHNHTLSPHNHSDCPLHPLSWIRQGSILRCDRVCT
jgi:hypothetical protein